MSKVLSYNGVNLRLVTKKELSRIIGRSFDVIQTWVVKGVLLPPTFEDPNKVKRVFGGEFTYKFYVYQEALKIREIVKAYNPRKGWSVTQEFVDDIHRVQLEVRADIAAGSKSLMDYPIILEFTDFKDLKAWCDKNGAPPGFAETIYRSGNKFIDPGVTALLNFNVPRKNSRKRNVTGVTGEKLEV